MSDTSDLSVSLSSYRSLDTVMSSNHGDSDCIIGGGTDGGSRVSSRIDENRNGNVVSKDTRKTLVKGVGVGGGSSAINRSGGREESSVKSFTASHSSRLKRLTTIPSSMIAPLSPLVEFSSTHLDESMVSMGPINPVRRRSSLGGVGTKIASSASSHFTTDSAGTRNKRDNLKSNIVGGDSKSPGSTASSSYPSRPSSRKSVDGSQRSNKFNVSHSSNFKPSTSALSSSSSVASSVRRRRQHLTSPTLRSKTKPLTSRSRSPVPSSSHSSVRSHQQRSVLSSRSQMSPKSYMSPPPRRGVSPKKLSATKSGLAVSNNSRRPLSPVRNSPAMSRFASPRRAPSPTGLGAVVNNSDGAVFVHAASVESSWATQIGRLRESFDREHAQYLVTRDDHPTEGNNDLDEMRIRVIVRKRPMSKRESSDGAEIDVIQPLVYRDHGRVLVHQPKTKLDLAKEVETTCFAFDNTFDERSNNIDIYESAVQSLIPGLFRGKWASVFAYGQTGSGKTVRMRSTSTSTVCIF